MVVFVAGRSYIKRAFAELVGPSTSLRTGCGVEEAVGLALGAALSLAVAASDSQEDFAGLRVGGDEVEEAVVLAGGAAVLVGV